MRDHTSGAAINNVAADHLIPRLELLEEFQRVLVFANAALGMSPQVIGRPLGMNPQEVQRIIDDGLEELRADPDLQHLRGMHTLGRLADFQEHIYRLQLESWFCKHCDQFQIQKGRGRTRETCSDHCRRAYHKAQRQKRAST